MYKIILFCQRHSDVWISSTEILCGFTFTSFLTLSVSDFSTDNVYSSLYYFIVQAYEL